MADYATPHAEVVCQRDSNIAVVRFALTSDEDPIVYRQLPASVDQGLSVTPTLGLSNCTMANGWTIRLRDGQQQAFGYGQGGADPPAFFSLWIAKRKILSRKQWKPGYGMDEAPRLIGIVIRPDRLSYCYAPHTYAAPNSGAIACQDKSFQLTRYAADGIEYARPSSRPPVGTILLAYGTTEPRLCRKFLRLRPKGFQGVSTTVNDSANVFPAEAIGQDINVATIEVSPGALRKLVRWSGTNHYFDGDVMLLTPLAADPSKILQESMLDDSGDKFSTDKLPPGWSVIAGHMAGLYPQVSWRYVHFDTQRIDGRLYLLAQPSNQEQRPTAILVQPLARGFKTICVFQRVEPHF
ncbi:hypothetical protein [Mesorhizobium sp. B1-1-8]|uniref:hypothetical protein n=1 Tax=Mesorhizobium sp. B1-1-8 TaxID=2589976 RepID=UPI001126C57D|nr:hypothetical protein [Mesorhizobium sp. B1-1-8]UCI05328.1 hypothetical protein FJ974_15840 [Mesorhizobium sp. B1-1-8]